MMQVLLGKKIVDGKIKKSYGLPFYDGNIANAFRKAKNFAGKEGFVATLPDLVHGRIVAPAQDEIWTNWFTPNTEELVGTTAQGNNVFVVNHDIVVLTPEVLEEALKDKDKRTQEWAARITNKQLHHLFEIKPVYSFDELKKQTVLPRSYAVVIDFDVAKKTVSDYQDTDRLPENPIFVARAGTVEQATEYVKKANTVYKTNKLGQWHPLNSIDSAQPQGRVPYLGVNIDDGFDGDDDIGGNARPVGVAPEALEDFARSATQKNAKSPLLEDVLDVVGKFVPECNKQELEKELRKLYD